MFRWECTGLYGSVQVLVRIHRFMLEYTCLVGSIQVYVGVYRFRWEYTGLEVSGSGILHS